MFTLQIRLPEGKARTLLKNISGNIYLISGNLSGNLSAQALEYMRSQKVSHMDLKPQNILLSSPANPILKVGGKISLNTLVDVT